MCVQSEAADQVIRKQRSEVQLLAGQDLTQYKVRGSEHDWQQALHTGTDKKMVSIKRWAHCCSVVICHKLSHLQNYIFFRLAKF